MKKRSLLRHLKPAEWVLVLYLLVAVLAPFIAGNVPLIVIKDSQWSFPVLKTYFNDTNPIEKSIYDFVLMPLIPYAPQQIDKNHQSGIGPFDDQHHADLRYRHWLGTDNLGRDVAAGMIHGTSTALKIGCISVFFSFLIGVTIGLFAAYYSDNTLKTTIPEFLIITSLFFAGMFYLIMEFLVFSFSMLLFGAGVVILIGLLILIRKVTMQWTGFKRINFPLDLLLLKIIEVRKSFPGLLILLAMVSFFTPPSVWNIILIITLLSWTEFARYSRAETLGLRDENFIISAKVIGLNDFRIIFYHILPNILPTLIVVTCFSLGSAILLESSLSFLGIGLPVEEVTWGKLMSEGRNMNAWWLVAAPGIAIFILIFCLNQIAEKNYKSVLHKSL